MKMQTKVLLPIMVALTAIVLLGCTNPVTSTTDTVVNIAVIPGVAAPVLGATPVTTITETAQYTGTVAWNGTPATFAGSTVYTATITLTAKAGFTLTGVAANSFTVAGATATNAVNSGVVIAVFPTTGVAHFALNGTWVASDFRAPDNSWQRLDDVHFIFSNTKAEDYARDRTTLALSEGSSSAIVYYDNVDNIFIKRFESGAVLPPDVIGKFQKFTWAPSGINILISAYKVMETENLALNNNEVGAIGTMVPYTDPAFVGTWHVTEAHTLENTNVPIEMYWDFTPLSHKEYTSLTNLTSDVVQLTRNIVLIDFTNSYFIGEITQNATGEYLNTYVKIGYSVSGSNTILSFYPGGLDTIDDAKGSTTINLIVTMVPYSP